MMRRDRPGRLYLDRFAWIALALALILRIVVVLVFYVDGSPHGGDGVYYLTVAGQPARLGFPGEWGAPVTSIGPGYPLFLASFVALLPDSSPVWQLVAIRLGQALFDTLLVLMVYRIAFHLFGLQTARIALAAQALDARYLFQNGSIATEAVFIALFAAFMLAYLLAVDRLEWGRYRFAGLLLGLAILVRPVPTLFFVFVLLHALLIRGERRLAVSGSLWLVAVMLLVITPWFVRTGMVSGEFIPGADTVFSHFWLASREDGRELKGGAFYEIKIEEFSEDDFNRHTDSSEYTASGIRNILAEPFKWFGRAAGDTLGAYLQPYGTTFLIPSSGVGAREVLLDFVRGRAPFSDVTVQPGLLRRLLMYIWHFWGLVGGLAGIVMAWRDSWRQIFPLVAWIVYGTAIAAVLLIEPRYIFPLMFAFTIFASYATARLWTRLTGRTSAAPGS